MNTDKRMKSEFRFREHEPPLYGLAKGGYQWQEWLTPSCINASSVYQLFIGVHRWQ
jgi:hypothetical protein